MTKLSSAINSKVRKMGISAELAVHKLKSRIKNALISNDGSVFTSEGLLVVITVVLAGIALAYFIPFFKTDLGNQLKSKTAEFFAMK
ncbi:MAG: hypothetical protein RR622_07935 [Hydrogenoanaerobacterium sp.]